MSTVVAIGLSIQARRPVDVASSGRRARLVPYERGTLWSGRDSGDMLAPPATNGRGVAEYLRRGVKSLGGTAVTSSTPADGSSSSVGLMRTRRWVPGQQMIKNAIRWARRLVATVAVSDEQPKPAPPRKRDVISDWPDYVIGADGNDDGPSAEKPDGEPDGGPKWVDDSLSLPPLYDRGGGVAVYRGPSGPIGKLARIEINRRLGKKDLAEGLGDRPFSPVFPDEEPNGAGPSVSSEDATEA